MHSLTHTNTEAEKRVLGAAFTCIRTCVFIYIIYIIFAAPLGFYEAVLLPPRERGAHSKNHTTDKRNGGIICRSRGSSGERAGSDICRWNR